MNQGLLPSESLAAYERLIAVVGNEDELGVVIRCQLLIEHELDSVIELLVPKKEFYKDLKPRFEKKIILALMLGLPRHFQDPLLELGRIRNRFAHKPEYFLSKKDIADFFNSNPADFQEIIQRAMKKDSRPALLKTGFIYNALNLQAALLKFKYDLGQRCSNPAPHVDSGTPTGGRNDGLWPG